MARLSSLSSQKCQFIWQKPLSVISAAFTYEILVSVFSLNLSVLILDSTQYLSTQQLSCLNPILHHGYGKRLFLMGWLLKSISGQFKHKSCQQLTVSINHSRYIHTCHVIGELPTYFALARGHGISSITHSEMTKQPIEK